MSGEAEHWRACADACDLVLGVARRRNTFPRLIALMEADAAKYREWARRLEAEKKTWPWAGIRMPRAELWPDRWL